MESAKLNKLGLRLNEDWNIYDLLSLTKVDGLTDSQFEKLTVLRDAIYEYNSTIPVDNKHRISGPSDAAALLYMVLKGKPHEECWVIFCNQAGKVLRRKLMTIGGQSSTIVDNKLILRTAIQLGATGVILAHNHPSGDPNPSGADLKQTESLQHALDVLDITLMDHIIISDNCYFSFTENKKDKYDKKLLKDLLQ